ncbi:hypothetical protein ACWCXB_29860 [Streptomyces sp. NPDC001514]
MKSLPSMYLGAPQVQAGQVASVVQPDQVGVVEEVLGCLIAGGAVADKVDVGAVVEAADEEAAGDAEQVSVAVVDDAAIRARRSRLARASATRPGLASIALRAWRAE